MKRLPAISTKPAVVKAFLKVRTALSGHERVL